MFGCQTDPIVVDPAKQVMGQVVDPSGNPISGDEIDLYQMSGTTLSTQFDTTVTASDGTFTLDFIRHTDVGTEYVVYLPSAYDFPLVGFADHEQIQVDLVSTALYEMLIAQPGNSPISAFTPDQIDSFLTEARSFINSQISRNLIQLTVSVDILHKAYKNAVCSDPTLLNLIAAATTLNNTANGTLYTFNKVTPFPNPDNAHHFDQIPSIVGSTPKSNSATVNENQTLPLSISAADYANPPDYIFYAWSIKPIADASATVGCDITDDIADGTQITTEQDLGPEVTLPNTTYSYNYTPNFSTAPWFEPNVAYKIIARASDGGKTSVKIWCTTVVNVERAPTFTTTASVTANEDQTYYYTPAATSPDSAPIYLKLGTYPGQPATSGPGVMDMCYNSNWGNLHLCISDPAAPNTMWNKATLDCPAAPAHWVWQNKGGNCSVPNQIMWRPTNCQSASPNAVQVIATDAIGTQGYQNFNISVNEINTAPTFTSTAPLYPNPQAVEAVPWTYQITTSDPQADPTKYPGLIAGSDNPPYPDLGLPGNVPGGVACPDALTYSFILNPPSATIDKNTGLINWTPQDNEVGIQSFIVQVADGHGGITTQSFNVQTAPMELPPTFAGAPTGNTPIAVNVNEDLFPPGTPYIYTINVGDPNKLDNNFGKLMVTDANLPPLATSQWGPSPAQVYTMPWPISDTMVPAPTGTTYTFNMTLCDTNQADLPWGVYGGGAYEVAGPPHNHFCVLQPVTITAPKRNFQPQIVSNPPSTAIGGQTYNYQVVITDGNISPADTFTIMLDTTATSPAAPVNPPAAMTIAPTGTTAPTGYALISWTPNNSSDLGSHIVQVSVKDSNSYPGGSHTNTQLFSIFVQEANVAPTITSSCPTAAQDGTQLVYNVVGHTTATTSPNNKLTYSIVSGPSGMAIDSVTGKLTWTPSVAQAQVPTQSFTVGVKSNGTTPSFPATTQSCTVNMTYVTLPPVFTPMSNETVPINAPMSVTVIATDPAGNPITLGVSGLPTGATYVDNGNGTGTFTWTPTVTGTFNITFTAQNTYQPGNQHLNATPLAWTLTVANSPIFQSHPVTSANPAGQYVYEVHCLDPAGKGLTYAISTGPGGMSVQTNATTHITTVTWHPGNNDVGNNAVTLRATDGNGAFSTQSWTINVSTGPDSGPTINSSTPSFLSTVTLSEGVLTNIVMNASEPEGYPLHYDWYLDNNWIYDQSGTYPFLPTGTQAGNHSLVVNVTDGALSASVSFNIHVRDTIPVAGATYNLPGGHLIEMGLLPVAQELVTLQGPSSAVYSIFPETGFSSGAISTVTGFAFSPTRMVIENDFPQNNYLLAFFASNNQINGSGISYAQVPSDTLTINSCSAAVCFNKVFSNAYSWFGGTNTPYKQSSLTRFDINPGNRGMLSSATNGAPNVDASLGAVSASAVIYDPTMNKVYVSVGPSDEILVVDPTTRAVTNTISLPLGSYPTAMHMNTVTKLLYVYNTGNGSLTEINATLNTVNSTSSGLPSSPSVGNDPGSIMVGNDADNLLYIAVPDTGAFLIFDINAGNFKSLLGLGASTIFIDPATPAVVGASYSNSEIIQLQ